MNDWKKCFHSVIMRTGQRRKWNCQDCGQEFIPFLDPEILGILTRSVKK